MEGKKRHPLEIILVIFNKNDLRKTSDNVAKDFSYDGVKIKSRTTYSVVFSIGWWKSVFLQKMKKKEMEKAKKCQA